MKLSKTEVFCLMADKDLTMKALAGMADLSFETTSKAIKGFEVSARTAGKIARALGVNTFDIIEVGE